VAAGARGHRDWPGAASGSDRARAGRGCRRSADYVLVVGGHAGQVLQAFTGQLDQPVEVDLQEGADAEVSAVLHGADEARDRLRAWTRP